jgi:type VI secretion system secreted protein VgrG
VTDFEWRLMKSYSPREYCVQFGETNFDFVSRLLAEEGIFYFFLHEKGKHTMVLADSASGVEDAPGATSIRATAYSLAGQEDVIIELAREAAVHTAGFALRDFDYLAPAQPVEGSMSGTGEARFEFPGGFKTRSDGDRYARIRLEEQEAMHQTVIGRGTARALGAGYRFTVSEHFQHEANRRYVAVSVSHKGFVTGYRSGEHRGAEYENTFVAIPDDVPYRPPRLARKPQALGAQTAVVVGKSGEEMWVDKYGRVKVKFHWDRSPGKDEKSSCWVRVASSWAGKSWGALQLPRIGQEVVIEFLNGDPDQPLIVGSVYNADQMPPYTPATTPWMSGVRTRSMKQGGDQTFSELKFNDEKGKEEVVLHAERNLLGSVQVDETHTVGNDRTTTIKKNDTRTVSEGNDTLKVEKGDQAITIAKGNQTIAVDTGNQKTTIKGDQTTAVKGKQDTTVTGDVITTVEQGAQKTTVKKGDQTVDVKMGKRATTIDMGNDELTLKMGSQNTTVKMGNVVTKASLGKITLEAMAGIELKVGQSKIVIDQTGVTINGMLVKLDAKVQTAISGTITEVKGAGMLMVKGAITMIN